MAHTITQKVAMIVPEVMAGTLEKKMIDLIKLSPLAIINTDLQGQGGDEITVPYYAYIGDAVDLAEGVAGEASGLTASTMKAKIKKTFKAVEITDEALMANFGNPIAEAERQMALAMASKVESDCYAVLEASTNVTDLSVGNTESITCDKISQAVINLFGEDIDEDIFCFVNPKQYGAIRTSSDFKSIKAGEGIVSGEVGDIYGVRIVSSARVTNGTNIFLKKGGLQIAVKRGVNVEKDRDILKKTTVLSADRHYVAHIYDESKVGVMTVKAS